ncbi:MAG: prepilin-type N-terminal cleavage/methylation domain-containing protein [Cellulomonas sp.]
MARRLEPARDDGGMSLVEVIVAMFIFAIVSSGVIYGMISVVAMSRDSRAREVAANLASQEIDLARDSANLFALLDVDRTTVVGKDTYYVHRATQWVSDPNLAIACGAGGGNLRYKRVNVTVTWENMSPGTSPVRSDTVVQPDAKVNDPTKGTILISVLGVGGTGISGVTVTAVPSSTPGGAVALTDAPVPTDAQGCTYVLKVIPGNYDVTVSRSGYVDATQAPTSTTTIGVSAGTSTSAAFQYDAAGTFNVTYAGGFVPPIGEPIRVAAVPTTTFVSTYGTFASVPGSSNSMMRTFKLHPFSSGYQAFAGDCAAADPEAWPNSTNAGGQAISGIRANGVAAAPGGSVAVGVPMGVVKISIGTGGTRYLRVTPAVSPVAGSGDPGCGSTPPTVSFGTATGYGIPANGVLWVALPYGSWRLYYGTGTTVANWTTAVSPGQMSLPATPLPERSTINPSGVVTFDPRVVTP